MSKEFATIHVDGLRELNKEIKALDPEAAKQMRLVLNDAAQIIVNVARPKVPAVTGNARASIVVRSTQKESRVRVGGPKAPYYPWLDFGGAVGRNNSVKRTFLKHGRYLFPSYSAQRDNILKLLQKRISLVAVGAGFSVDKPVS